MKRSRIDVVLDPAYAHDLGSRSLDELGAMRTEVDDLENEVSFCRRVLHGRLDILRFEVRRRNGEDSRSVIEALPEVLAAGIGGGKGQGNALDRLPADFAPELPEVERRFPRVMDDDVLTRLPELGDDDLALALDELGTLEARISGQRTRLHDIHDLIVTEIAGRHVAVDPA